MGLYYKMCLIIVAHYSPVPRDVGKGSNTLPNNTGYRGVDSPVFFDCLGGNVGLGREFFVGLSLLCFLKFTVIFLYFYILFLPNMA